ncbi:MAG: sigma-70 family RNA polymerase sigma factor [Gammaproteobacteria bacterium]|nr:sigma-70 family RNA polymerase sigma factor [Gammaproteobacteria bacterium]
MPNNRDLFMRWFDAQPQIEGALKSRLGDSPDLPDLAQEVFLRLLRITRPELIRDPEAYVYRVALNVAQEWRLRAAQSKDHSSDALDALESPDVTEEMILRRQRQASIRRVVEDLPAATRSALLLHVYRDMTYQQVAEHMGVSRRSVKRYLANGYAALRIALAAAPNANERGSSNER